ncbi:hypothetical protein V1358_08055 [Pseudoalteromonas sp. YIC-656]|uniref:hypothetical protein n=1 Tax=Pseudoalteromonas pernae TaxID=3118054 RepID=UPI0032428AE5
MKQLIIHVGPGKCASSTIQQFYKLYACELVVPTVFRMLPAASVNSSSLHELKALSKRLPPLSNLIVSHESLFKFPELVRAIAQTISPNVERVIVIGYSREQSSFIRSSFKQWLFRSVERKREVESLFADKGLNIDLFTGMEQALIAGLLSNFKTTRQLSGHLIHQWHKSYSHLERSLKDLNVELSVGTIKPLSQGFDLLHDFADRANFDLGELGALASDYRANESFSEAVVEYAYNNVERLNIGPHDGNELLIELSRLDVERTPVANSNILITALSGYIQKYYQDENLQFCRQFNVQRFFYNQSKSINQTEALIDALQVFTAQRKTLRYHEGYLRFISKHEDELQRLLVPGS